MVGYLGEIAWYIRRLRGLVEQCQGRVFVLHQYGCEPLPIAVRLAFPGHRVVAVAHTPPGRDTASRYWVRRLVERLCACGVGRVIFNSRFCRDAWKTRVGHAIRHERVILPGIGKPDLSVPEDYPANRSPGVVDFVYVAQFLRGKGQAEFLNAWRRAAERTPRSIRLVFIGDGSQLHDAKEIARSLGLGESVVFLGARANGARYFNGADVAVLTPHAPEAFGLVLLEAMSRGLPVLATRFGGIPEVVEDGKTGILMSPEDTDGMASAIERLASQVNERREMGEAGRQRWEESFTVERMLTAYDEFFSQMGKE
jgi:glycosyltransferase involved in cell wall biosynthesis